jgi:hypothetical protein
VFSIRELNPGWKASVHTILLQWKEKSFRIDISCNFAIVSTISVRDMTDDLFDGSFCNRSSCISEQSVLSVYVATSRSVEMHWLSVKLAMA